MVADVDIKEKTMENEKVLVFPADLLKTIGYFEGIQTRMPTHSTNKILMSNQLFYMDRKLAEDDPSYKQLIPYCMLTSHDGIFVYQRTKKAGDSRLHELYSLGIGGHINPIDSESNDWVNTYNKSIERELEEEVSIDKTKYDTNCIVGLIYDPSNSVGQVHFGIIHEIGFNKTPKLQSSDPVLTNGEFRANLWIKENKDKFENWSKLIIENMM